jgi:hypothetical protein
MTVVTLTNRRLGALDGRSPVRVRATGRNACGQLPAVTLQALAIYRTVETANFCPKSSLKGAPGTGFLCLRVRARGGECVNPSSFTS